MGHLRQDRVGDRLDVEARGPDVLEPVGEIELARRDGAAQPGERLVEIAVDAVADEVLVGERFAARPAQRERRALCADEPGSSRISRMWRSYQSLYSCAPTPSGGLLSTTYS